MLVSPRQRQRFHPPFRITPGTVSIVHSKLRIRLHEQQLIRCNRLRTTFLSAGIPFPKTIPEALMSTTSPGSIDREISSSLSQLVDTLQLTLTETIALWRNESREDSRPNKAMDPVWLDIVLHGYRHQQCVVTVAKFGVSHNFTVPRVPDPEPTRNHASAREYNRALARSIGDGQAQGTYLVLDLPVALRWSALRFSPFGCVPKKDVNPKEAARLIHDLSYPKNASINNCSTQSELPVLNYDSVRLIARRIEELVVRYPRLKVKILKGDVKTAFRLIAVAASLAAHFAGSTRDLAVIDLALPFGWTGSPPFYGAFGDGISFLVSRESPHSLDPNEADKETFFSFVWVDDHILLEADYGNRLFLAEAALRLSMLAVLGPNAINEKKFSRWSTKLDALGLSWDTEARTISMPPEKVDKALTRIASVLQADLISRHQLEKLLGSLRYMSLCCRSARAFVQRLHQVWCQTSRFHRIRLSAEITQDLRWVECLLQNGRANKVSTSVVAGTLEPAVHLFMDACDEGLCILYPSAREYVRLHFDVEELQAIKSPLSAESAWFSINVREALSAVLAVLVWGPRWSSHVRANNQPVHIRCWIDNKSAVAWLGNQQSRNPSGQELNRVLACAELQFGLHVSTEHLRGSSNFLADLGSRAWTGHMLEIWTNRVRSWCSQDIPPEFRKIYKPKLSTCNGTHYRTLPANATSPPHVEPVVPILQPARNLMLATLITFVVESWNKPDNVAPNRFETIRAKISHVRWYHQACVGFRPHLQPQHELVLRGIRRISPPRRQRAAVTIPMLQAIAKAANFSIAQHRVVCGAAVLGFFFCLRGAEYLASRGRFHSYCLQVRDIVVLDSTGLPTGSFKKASSVEITIRGSKTDQAGQSSKRVLLRSDQAPVCPVFAALLLKRNAEVLRLPPIHPVCSTSAGKILSADLLTRVLRGAATQCGEEPSGISTHSLRTGGATAMHSAGFDADTIRMRGRWASDAYQVYIRQALASRLQLAKRMGRALANNHLAPDHSMGHHEH
ncbi:hypothetical protein PHMEG_00019592 [Phytophthora megakarya]|uniref:Tyr recombinase domain-containing protein n=1 Tax=Phytophthora megakarya TaxID=4795 RepID=A0A225VS15_9STRA|nr:hypothetical protein PHMEG_00019592 [Phytophthora megakarya]